jgi:hypothetical protein
MLIRTRSAQYLFGFLIGPGLLCVLGCSADDGLGRRYHVSGTVKYKGEPVAKGQISFVPAKGGSLQGASGVIENGSFKLSTLGPGDGALPGDYKVTFSAYSISEDEQKAEAAKIAAKHGMKPDQIPPTLLGRGAKNAKRVLPTKYQVAETSDITAKVEEKSNYYEFDLKD